MALTIKQIAKQIGVSPTTISNVIHGNKGKVSPEKYALIQKKLDEMNFAPNLAAAMLAHNSTHIVGIILNYENRDGHPPLHDPYVSTVVGAIEHQLQQYGYYAMLYSSVQYEKWIRLVSTWNMAGLIVLGISREKCEQVRQKTNVPVVFLDSYLSDTIEDEKNDQNKTFYNVGLDDLQGAYIMTKYLMEKGHKKIAFLADRQEVRGVDAFRLMGFKKAVNESETVTGDFVFFSRDRQERQRKIEEIVKKGLYTALFFASDYYASESVHYLQAKNYRIPEDVSIAGFDDNEFAVFCNPKLTTIRQDVVEKGNQAVDLLAALINKENISNTNIRLPVELIERESVKSIL